MPLPWQKDVHITIPQNISSYGILIKIEINPLILKIAPIKSYFY